MPLTMHPRLDIKNVTRINRTNKGGVAYDRSIPRGRYEAVVRDSVQ